MGIRLPVVLREEPQFRLLFGGQALSILGDRITLVALPFAVLSIGGGPGEVGLVAAATTVPFAVLALLGGVWADRLPRHRVMLASDLVRCLAQATAAGLLLGGAAQVWHLAALGVLFGTADAFFSPALIGLLPAVVSPGRLQQANALRSLVQSSGLVLGPALAGVIVALLGPGGAIAVDAATFAASAAALALLRPPVAARPESGPPTLLGELAGGWREVRARRWVQVFLGVLFTYSAVVLPSVFVLGPVLADRELGGVGAWATIVVCFGIGSVVGDLLILRLQPQRPLVWSAAGFVVASGQAAFIGSGLGVGGIAALEGLAGVAVSAAWGLWETTLQEQIPEHAISRVSSFDFLCSAGAMPIGLVLAGPVAASLGLRATLILETVVGVPVAVAVLLVADVRRVRRRAPDPAAALGTA